MKHRNVILWSLCSVMIFLVIFTGVQAQELKEVNNSALSEQIQAGEDVIVRLYPPEAQVGRLEKVYSSDILEQIQAGEDVYLRDALIIGKLDFSESQTGNFSSEELKVVESGITITNSVFLDDVDFSSTRFRKHIDFYNTTFLHHTDFSGVRFNKYADFASCKFLCIPPEYGQLVTNESDKSTFYYLVDTSCTYNFSYASFENGANFYNVFFGDDADFRQANFSGDANFRQTNFSNDANFMNASFRGYADFWQVNFSDDAWFHDSSFKGDVDFSKVSFGDKTVFVHVNYSSNVDFSKACFGDSVYFYKLNFSEDANFYNVSFIRNAEFYEVHFCDYVNFTEANLGERATFRNLNFGDEANFNDATFGNSRFKHVNFSGAANFNSTTFGWGTLFLNSTFNNDVSFEGARFEEYAIFQDVKFRDYACFDFTKFDKLWFSRTEFTKISFLGADFKEIRVEWSSFKKALIYDPWTYPKLIKNFKEQGRFRDADDAYYQFRRLRQADKWSDSTLLDVIEWVLCGYGVKWVYPIIWGVLTILGCAFIYWRSGGIKQSNGKDNNQASFLDALYFSMVTFTTIGYGDWYPVGRYRLVVIVEGLFGWLCLGFFLVTLANVIIKSS